MIKATPTTSEAPAIKALTASFSLSPDTSIIIIDTKKNRAAASCEEEPHLVRPAQLSSGHNPGSSLGIQLDQHDPVQKYELKYCPRNSGHG